MRKVFVASMAVLFVLISVSAYACGNKNANSKVDASKAKVTTAQACTGANSAKVQTAEATATSGCSGEVKVQTAEATRTTGLNSCAAKKTSAEQVNLNGKSGCPYQAQNASVKMVNGGCPASDKCPATCVKAAKNANETVEKPAAKPAVVEVAAKANQSE